MFKGKTANSEVYTFPPKRESNQAIFSVHHNKYSEENMEQIYCDYNATTPIHPIVKERMISLMDTFGNPASIHGIGQEAERVLVESKEVIAEFLNCSPENLIFTSGGTESNNTVLFQLLAEKISNKPERKLICSEIEHSSISEYSTFLKKSGIEVVYIPVDPQGFVNLEELQKEITKNSLVSIIWANNEIGTIQNIEKISEIVKDAGAELHVDATQALGKVAIDLSSLHIHWLTATAHKIYGPRGIGLLYRRAYTRFAPMLIGGGQQEDQRAGTENHLLMAGFAEAINQRKVEMAEESIRLRSLKTKLINEIISRFEFAQINGPIDERGLAGTINVTFHGVENEMLLLYLDMAGISISTGSACSSRTFKASRVLNAIGRSDLEAFSSVRISLGRESTETHVDRLVEKLSEIIGRIRKE